MNQVAEPPTTISWKAASEIIGVLIGAAVLTMASREPHHGRDLVFRSVN